MFAEKFFQSPILGERADIRDIEFVVRNADLDGREAGVILVDKRIENQFAQRLPRERELFDALFPVFVPNLCLEIFEIYQVERFFRLFDQGAVDIVMVKEVGLVLAEFSDLDVGAGDPFFGLFREQESRGVGDAVFAQKVQVRDEFSLCLAPDGCVEPALVDGQVFESLDFTGRNVLHLQSGTRQVLPVQAAALEKEGLEPGAGKPLVRRPAADIENAPEGNRNGIGGNDDFDQILSVLPHVVDIRNHSHGVAHQVGNGFEERFPVGDAENSVPLFVVGHADQQPSAIGVCEPADPLEVFIPPSLFVFDVPVFFFHGCDASRYPCLRVSPFSVLTRRGHVRRLRVWR